MTHQTRRKEAPNPVLDIRVGEIVPRADNTALVDAPVELHHNFTSPVVIDVLKFVDVTVFLHDLEEFDHHLGHGAHKNLALAALFSVVHRL